MSNEPPLPLEEYASLAAEMDAGFPKDETLERAKLDDDRWLVVQAYWLKRMGDEAERQRFETTTRYRTVFGAKRSVFAAKWKNRHKKAKPVAPDATPLRHVEELLGMKSVLEPSISIGMLPPVAIPAAVRPIVSAPMPPIVGAPIAPAQPARAPMGMPMPPERFVPQAAPVSTPISERAPDTAPMPPPTMERAPPAHVETPGHVFIPHAAPAKPASVVATAPPPPPVASTMPAPPAAVPPSPMRIDAEALKQALGTAAVGGRTMSVDIQQLLAAATPFMKKPGDASSGAPPSAAPATKPPATAPAPQSAAPLPTSPVPNMSSAGASPLPVSHRDHPLNRTSPSSADFASAVRAATPFKSATPNEVGSPLPVPPPPPPVVPVTPLPPRMPAYPPFGGPAPKPTALIDDDGGPRTQVVPEQSGDGSKNAAPPEPWRAPSKKENPLAQTMFADFQTSGGTALPFGSEKSEAKPNRALPNASPSSPGVPPAPPPPRPAPSAPVAPAPSAKRFTINQFASLTAEIAENPANISAVRAKYGLSEAQHREESERWTTEFEKNAEIKQRYFGIVHRYREYLRKRPT